MDKKTFEEKLAKYAELIVKKGANVQSGQDVMVYAGLDQPEFVTAVVEKCYEAGARKVSVEWSHQPIELAHINGRSLEVLSVVEEWEKAKLQHRVDTLPAMIFIESDDPDGLAGADQKKYSLASQARYKIIKPYRDKMENKYQWCIAAVPGKKWAKKVFDDPDIDEDSAVELLWEAILKTSRVTDDPIAEWESHNADLRNRCKVLNDSCIRTLHYTSSNGTDLRVGLMPQSRFCGGEEKTVNTGVPFNPNIPSEEVFTSPMAGKADGVVYSTMPLSYRGQLIENFHIVFKDGKAVEWKADKNEDLLGEMIGMDKGACMLGECALIPKDSPISEAGLLFYNTLFDENASCHLAMGDGYANTMDGFENMTLEECRKLGLNESMIHVDFMIGADDLAIEGECEDGSVMKIFENGTWAF